MRRQTELIWGLIAVALAAWWGARTLDLIPVGLDDFIQRALPALLVLAGLTLFLRRRLPLSGGIALIVTVALVGGIGYSAYSSRATQQRTDTQQSILQTINPNLTLLRLHISTLTTEVELLGSPAQGVINGTFEGSSDSSISVDYQEAGDGSATLTLREVHQSGDFPLLEAVGRSTLKLDLPPFLPMDVDFDAADGNVVLNMGGVALERLNATAERGDLIITLPDYNPIYSQPEDTLGTLTAANGNLAIFIPANVAARLEFTGSGEPQFDRDRYFLLGDTNALVAQNITVAENVVHYTLNAPRGTIRVENSP